MYEKEKHLHKIIYIVHNVSIVQSNICKNEGYEWEKGTFNANEQIGKYMNILNIGFENIAILHNDLDT